MVIGKISGRNSRQWWDVDRGIWDLPGCLSQWVASYVFCQRRARISRMWSILSFQTVFICNMKSTASMDRGQMFCPLSIWIISCNMLCFLDEFQTQHASNIASNTFTWLSLSVWNNACKCLTGENNGLLGLWWLIWRSRGGDFWHLSPVPKVCLQKSSFATLPCRRLLLSLWGCNR